MMPADMVQHGECMYAWPGMSRANQPVQVGIPQDDMQSWADSCPSSPGFDELGNYLTYNTPVCFAAVGHMTAGQIGRAHYVTSELNPVLYAWGQVGGRQPWAFRGAHEEGLSGFASGLRRTWRAVGHARKRAQVCAHSGTPYHANPRPRRRPYQAGNSCI